MCIEPLGDSYVGATLVVALVGHANAVHHMKTGDHKGRPYGGRVRATGDVDLIKGSSIEMRR